jgi:dipeptidyl aminopeptidase/acylaminoacyl peptidase
MTRQAFAVVTGLGLSKALVAQSFRSAEASEPESFPDGSTGRISEFRGCDGTMIPAFVRKPKGQGPFPVAVILHGGARGKDATTEWRAQSRRQSS